MIKHPRSVRTQDEIDLQLDIAHSTMDDESPEDTSDELIFANINAAVSQAYESGNHKSKEFRINAITQKVFEVIKAHRSSDTSYELGVAATICWLFCEDYEMAPFNVDNDVCDCGEVHG